ncbi:hypothetical protein M011DRAFT_80156 [Sporormia fimetaria CBS 119925]|uniref:Methyltransferase domain-containing protein n=1 Tax=Sporormia fimetaria CBS 119925 TaxID=1340428 RepID=A0A6A6V7D9_9PLEO|nr:hypothetical protein M011DRAFT_80156 [Sporormia fimetaria CBS 119925]
MPANPPPFGSQEYWESRFTTNPNPFEWLEAPTALDPFLTKALQTAPEPDPHILHIGCGTSLLSSHLRAHVNDPETIHNLDYSEVAIRLGKERERELFPVQRETLHRDESHPDNHETSEVTASPAPSTVNPRAAVSPVSIPSTAYMRWSSADLLSPTSLSTVCQPQSYYIIVEKSTSDSIACAPDLSLPLPYPVGTSSAVHPSNLTETPTPIHPLHILAINLALVTKPGGYWISMSYSEDRYPFVPPIPPSQLVNDRSGNETEVAEDIYDIPPEVIEAGLPNPSELWKLEGKYEVEAADETEKPGSGSVQVVHRPKIMHWVYVLRRTEVPLFCR